MIRRHLRRKLACLLSAVTLTGVLLATAGPAGAELDLDNLPPVPECPAELTPPGAILALCIELHLNSGSAKFGSIETTFDDPIVVRQVVGAALNEEGQLVTIPVPGESTGVSFPEIVVPGGLFGGVPLLENLDLGPITGVSATIEPVGEMTLSEPDVVALLTGNGRLTTATIPFVVRVNNALLGSTCTIGNPNDPVVLNLDLDLSGGLVQAHYSELRASDTTFSVPAAQDCGVLGTGKLLNRLGLGSLNLFDTLVNGKVGLPSASGANHIVFDGVIATIAAQ